MEAHAAFGRTVAEVGYPVLLRYALLSLVVFQNGRRARECQFTSVSSTTAFAYQKSAWDVSSGLRQCTTATGRRGRHMGWFLAYETKMVRTACQLRCVLNRPGLFSRALISTVTSEECSTADTNPAPTQHVAHRVKKLCTGYIPTDPQELAMLPVYRGRVDCAPRMAASVSTMHTNYMERVGRGGLARRV